MGQSWVEFDTTSGGRDFVPPLAEPGLEPAAENIGRPGFRKETWGHSNLKPLWKKLLAGSALLALTGCVGNRDHLSNTSQAGTFRRLEGAGIENFYLLGSGVLSGSSPEGDTGFETLCHLGVKTLLSVDGAAPLTDLAAKHGLRYVHIPIGYGGISPTKALMIVKAAQTLPGPIFVHCHHGLHRGPVAAAIICEGLAGWTPEQGEAWLRTAGTSTNYPGLYRTVRDFIPPTAIELRRAPKNFVSRARTPSLVNTMVQIDEHFDVLEAFQKAGFKLLPEHPDATPVNESLILRELFREAHRTRQDGERGDKFLAELVKAETTANDFHLRIQELASNPALPLQAAESAFQNVSRTCIACHKAYRD